jgi:uncharacterized protein YraI
MATWRPALFAFALANLSPALAAQRFFAASDTPAVTTAHVNVRTHPLVTSQIVAKLPAGSRVVLGGCADGWCRVSAGNMVGYVLEEYLTRQAPHVQASQGKGYINSDGKWVPSPVQTPDGQPPAGATAQCRDGSYSFSQHRQGTCSHHGGVASWLTGGE